MLATSNRFQVLEQQDALDGPTSTPPSFKLPKVTTLRSGLDLALPHSRPSGLLDARRIKELVRENAEKLSCEEQLRVLADIASHMKKLPTDKPVAIPDPTSYINKANLMAIGHDARLEILDQLVPQDMWGTPKHTALLTEMGIDAAAISRCNSIQVPFQLHHGKGITNETALLDTGATESFMDVNTVNRLHLSKQALIIPCPVFNVDGTANKQGTITHVCHLLVAQGNKKQCTLFYITNLGTDQFILGYPWCQEFKPNIDWRESKLMGPKIHMETLLHGKLQHLKEFTKQQQQNKEDNDLIFNISAIMTEETPEESLADMEATLQDEEGRLLWSGVTTPEEECGRVAIWRTHNAVEMAHQYASTHGKAEVTLPAEFQRHAALFSDEEAKKFLPSRPYDHKIELTDATPAQFNCKMYPMSVKEQAAEDKFLDENLKKGYIQPSDSPYGFSTFQVPKKDLDEMRYIIDYRPLNAVTKRDVTPLPNLAQCIEDLQGMEIFSKFDIRWGYNNI